MARPTERHLAEGKRLKGQQNVVNLCMFWVGTGMPTVSKREGQNLETNFKNKAKE
jgi:hypothetical protein